MTDKRDLLIEIGTEELPPAALKKLSACFLQGLLNGLSNLGYSVGSSQGFASPRRLAAVICDVPVKQNEKRIERRGPALAAAFDDKGNPSKAALGFASSCGVAVDELDKVKTDKGEYLYYEMTQAGQETQQAITAIIEKALLDLPIPKRMRWGSYDTEFIRPVHWVVLIFGNVIVDTSILGIPTGKYTKGHRFHCAEPIAIDSPNQYESMLRDKGKVIADFNKRKENIKKQVLELAESLEGTVDIENNDDLLDEVTALVEWPVALVGSFEQQYLSVPKEALVMSMQTNQKYFPIFDRQGNLTCNFIIISNIESTDIEQVKKGNERVIRPRLADAAFFWEQDKKISLPRRNDLLKQLVFQKQLGSIYDKAVRISGLAKFIAVKIKADAASAERSGLLCKADLVSEMVGEFPKLQGIMGRYYAADSGEHEEVAAAIEEHYLPRFAGDRLPETGCGRSVAVADKLDTLVGIFAIGQKPTGEKDPFGLRRAAIGVLRILIDCQLNLDLKSLLECSASLYDTSVNAEKVIDEVFSYVMSRIQSEYEQEGFTPQQIQAVLATEPTKPMDFDERIKAIKVFSAMNESESLAAANKRIRNILKKADHKISKQIDSKILSEDAEKNLYQAINKISDDVSTACKKRKFEEALKLLSTLKEPVDQFFDSVMVMADDETIRNNRLSLLLNLENLFLRIADISKL